MRRRLPEREAQITVHVPDFPRSDGNIGVEEMMRGLGLSTTDSNDPHHHAPPSPHPTETEPSQNVSDAPPPAGYKSLDVLIEWSGTFLPSFSPPTHPYMRIHNLFSPSTKK